MLMVEKPSQKLHLQSILLETPSHWNSLLLFYFLLYYQDFLLMNLSCLPGLWFSYFASDTFSGQKGEFWHFQHSLQSH